MGLFDDKMYNEMDWLSKAVEPIVSPINDVLSKLPEEVILGPKEIMEIMASSYDFDISLRAAFIKAMSTHKIPYSSFDPEYDKIMSCFTMVREGEDIMVNLETMTAWGGSIRVIKQKKMFEEEELKKYMGAKGLEALSRADYDKVEIARANEIGELLGADIVRQKRSARQKLTEITNIMTHNMQENTWNIRNVEFADKVCEWVKVYLTTGNLAALTNFCKFKIMTHDGSPIYSMEEEAL